LRNNLLKKQFRIQSQKLLRRMIKKMKNSLRLSKKRSRRKFRSLLLLNLQSHLHLPQK
jgi:hypothetical protein